MSFKFSLFYDTLTTLAHYGHVTPLKQKDQIEVIGLPSVLASGSRHAAKFS